MAGGWTRADAAGQMPDPEIARTTQLTLAPGRRSRSIPTPSQGFFRERRGPRWRSARWRGSTRPGCWRCWTVSLRLHRTGRGRALPLLYLSDVARALGLERDATTWARASKRRSPACC
jgi:hypothetical protein